MKKTLLMAMVVFMTTSVSLGVQAHEEQDLPTLKKERLIRLETKMASPLDIQGASNKERAHMLQVLERYKDFKEWLSLKGENDDRNELDKKSDEVYLKSLETALQDYGVKI